MRFYFHYNKPLSRIKKKVIWTVHANRKCMTTSEINCSVATQTKTRKTQPFGVVTGSASKIFKRKGCVFIR